MSSAWIIHLARVLLWLIAIGSGLAWALDMLSVAMLSGGPNYTGSGLSQAQIAARNHAAHTTTALLSLLPVAVLVAVVGLAGLSRLDSQKASPPSAGPQPPMG